MLPTRPGRLRQAQPGSRKIAAGRALAGVGQDDCKPCPAWLRTARSRHAHRSACEYDRSPGAKTETRGEPRRRLRVLPNSKRKVVRWWRRLCAVACGSSARQAVDRGELVAGHDVFDVEQNQYACTERSQSEEVAPVGARAELRCRLDLLPRERDDL